MEDIKGTIITGSVRSGTTLALRVFCEGLTPQEERAGSVINEPGKLSGYIVFGNWHRAEDILPEVIKNRYKLIKSPHLAFLMPHIPPKYRVIATFRDLRFTALSITKHEEARKWELKRPYRWRRLNPRNFACPFDMAVAAVGQYYQHIAGYRGKLEVWNFGFWDEWEVKNKDIRNLYGRVEETSKEVREDVKNGVLFSDKNFSAERWMEVCERDKISAKSQSIAQQANQRLKELYQKRKLTLKTIEDLP